MKRIVILHGWTYQLDRWTPFLENLKKEGFVTEILKIPGLTKKSTKVWNLDSYVEWLNKNISPNESVVLLGHSNGGRIAAAFSAKYPKKVSKLVLIDSAGIYHKELHLEIKRLLFRTVAKVGKKLTNSSKLKKLLYKLAGETDYYKAPPETKKTMINLVKNDLKDILSDIKTPTLIIWGRDDQITPLSDAFIFSELIPDSRLEIVDNARHSPFFTHTKEVTRIIKNGL